MKATDKIINKIWLEIIKLHYYFYYFTFIKRAGYVLRYDEKPLDVKLNGQEEQALPGFAKYRKSGYYKYMLGRYFYASRYCRGKKVLDSGCGYGWGSYIISQIAKKVIGVDKNKKAIVFAKKHFKDENLIFKVNSILTLSKLFKKKFDVILGMEIIEHLNKKDGFRYFSECFGVLDKKGVLILSSYFPISEKIAIRGEKKNPFHLHIYTRKELLKDCYNVGFKGIKFLGNYMAIIRK